MYRILLTGGTGFVGKNLWKYLDRLGYTTENISKDEFMHEDFRRLKDMRLETELDRKPFPTISMEGYDRLKPDVVIHCAWPRAVDLHSTDHLEFAEMSCNFFNECKKRGIRVINLGSSSEYGPILEPRREDMLCTPNTTYGIAKLAVTLYAKKLGFNTLRLFTVAGEGGHNFGDIAKDSKKWSDRKQIRDYVSIDKVCLAVQRLIHAEHLYGEIINVASGIPVSNLKVAKYVLENKDVADDARWNTYPQTQYEPSTWVADTTKMKKLLNI